MRTIIAREVHLREIIEAIHRNPRPDENLAWVASGGKLQAMPENEVTRRNVLVGVALTPETPEGIVLSYATAIHQGTGVLFR